MHRLVYGKEKGPLIEVVVVSVSLEKQKELEKKGVDLPINGGGCFPASGSKEMVEALKEALINENGYTIHFLGPGVVKAISGLESRRKEIEERGGLLVMSFV